MIGYSALLKAPTLLKLHHQIVLCHILDTRWESLIPLQRCNRCILHPQVTGLLSFSGFSVPAGHRVKIKEREKINKFLDFAREPKKLRYRKVTFIPFVAVTLRTVHKSLEKS